MDRAQVKDIMTEDVVSIKPQTPVKEVIEILNDKGFSGVPVLGEDKELVGLITEYELINQQEIIKQLVKDPESEELHKRVTELMSFTAEAVMNKEPLTLKFDDSFEAAMILFHKHHRVNPVPVVDHENRLVGIVSRFDLVKLLKLYGTTG